MEAKRRLVEAQNKLEEEKNSQTSEFVTKKGAVVRYNGKDENVYVPEEVEEIAKGVFARSKKMKSVFIPASVKIIGKISFTLRMLGIVLNEE